MPGSLDNLEEAIRKLQEMYDDPDIVIPASQLPPKENPYKDFMDRNPQNKADGGRIGFYKGMSANKAKKKIKLKEPATLTGMAGDRKLSKKQIDALDPNYLGDFTGGDLERPKKVYKSGTLNSVIDDAIEIRNIIVNNKGNIFNLEELGEKAQIYTSGTGTRKSGKGNRPDIRRVRAALAVAKDNFPEIGNFKFVASTKDKKGNYKNDGRYKIDGTQRQQLNMVVDTIKAYQSATGDEKLAQFLPDNMGAFYKRVIEKGPKKLPANPEQGLYIKMYNFGPEQIKYISDRITDETGQKFTSKDYKNLVTDVKKYRASVSSDVRTQTRLANINKQIKDLADDSVIQNLLKGDLNRKTQEALLERATRLVGGDASIASRRLFMMAEAMSDTTNAYKNLGIELNNEKANKIIATGKEIGGRNNRYGMSSVLYDYYGNVVDKAIGSGEGQTFVGKYQQAIRNVLDKGQSPDEIFSLTASARRGLSPYALFTQQLRTDVNSAIKGAYIDSALSRTHGKLQEIFKGRKYSQLNAAEKEAANLLVEAFEKEKIRALNQPVNPGEVKKGAEPIYLTAAEKKNIQLPSFDLKNPPSKSIEGFATRFVKYPKIKEAFEKSYKDVGYSMKVTKDMKTQKEFLESQFAAIGCPGKAKGGRVGFNEGTNYQRCVLKGIKEVQTKSPDQLTPGAKANFRKITGTMQGARLMKNVLGPAALAYEGLFAAPFAVYDYASGRPGEDILKNFLTLGIADQKLYENELKQKFPDYGKAQYLMDFDDRISEYERQMGGTKGQMRRAKPKLNIALDNFKNDPTRLEFAQTEDPAASLFENFLKSQEAEQAVAQEYATRKEERGFGESVPQLDLGDFSYGEMAKGGRAGFESGTIPGGYTDDAYAYLREMDDEIFNSYKKYKAGGGKMKYGQYAYNAKRMMFGPFGVGVGRSQRAGGGIAKLAGIDDGPPPEKGPNSQGLQGLLNRVKKLKE